MQAKAEIGATCVNLNDNTNVGDACVPNDELSDSFDNLNVYMSNLFKQHNQTTQYLTYANQLLKLESYISNKLLADWHKVRSNSKDVRNIIHKIRQRYMDKQATVFFNYMIVGVMQVTIAVVLVSGIIMNLLLNGAIEPKLYYMLMGGIILFYFVYLYRTINLNSMRMRSNPNLFVFPKNPFFNRGSCTNN